MIAGTHPEGLKTPPPIAIASHIIRAWAEASRAARPVVQVRRMMRRRQPPAHLASCGPRRGRGPAPPARGSRASRSTRAMCDASGAVALPEGSFGDRFLMLNNDGQHPPHLCGRNGRTHRSRPISARRSALSLAEPRPDRRRGGDLARRRGDPRRLARTGRRRRMARRGLAVPFGRGRDGDGDGPRAPAGRSDRLLAGLAALDADHCRGDRRRLGGRSRRSPRTGPASTSRACRSPPTAPRSSSGSGTRCRTGARCWSRSSTPRPCSSRTPSRCSSRRSGSTSADCGIRSMEYSPAAGAYFIVAGPVGRRGRLRHLSLGRGGRAGGGSGRARGARLPPRLRPGRADHRPDRERASSSSATTRPARPTRSGAPS